MWRRKEQHKENTRQCTPDASDAVFRRTRIRRPNYPQLTKEMNPSRRSWWRSPGIPVLKLRNFPVNRKFPLLKMNTFPVTDNSASQSLFSLFEMSLQQGSGIHLGGQGDCPLQKIRWGTEALLSPQYLENVITNWRIKREWARKKGKRVILKTVRIPINQSINQCFYFMHQGPYKQ